MHMYGANCLYMSIHVASQGQRALVGKVNMDMRSPDILIETIEDSIRDTESFIEYLQQKNVSTLL